MNASLHQYDRCKKFTFKQFSVSNDLVGMPISTDGVLFGAWANVADTQSILRNSILRNSVLRKSILDIGSGTGLLSLMAAQRNSHAEITAIEIDPLACQVSNDNFKNSPWSNRLNLIEGDILDLDLAHKFDAIICNPPYFNSGIVSENQKRSIARHATTLNHHALIENCYQRLTENGKASFILPTIEGEAFIEFAIQHHWHLSRLCRVKPSARKPAHRLLFELSKQPSRYEVEELTIHTAENYSNEFIHLTKHFYISM